MRLVLESYNAVIVTIQDVSFCYGVLFLRYLRCARRHPPTPGIWELGVPTLISPVGEADLTTRSLESETERRVIIR